MPSPRPLSTLYWPSLFRGGALSVMLLVHLYSRSAAAAYLRARASCPSQIHAPPALLIQWQDGEWDISPARVPRPPVFALPLVLVAYSAQKSAGVALCGTFPPGVKEEVYAGLARAIADDTILLLDGWKVSFRVARLPLDRCLCLLFSLAV